MRKPFPKHQGLRLVIAALPLLLSTLLAVGCNVWGDYDNKVDPGAGNYQGYESESTFEKVAAALPAVSGGSIAKLVLPEWIGATLYEVRVVADGASPAATVVDSASGTGNEISLPQRYLAGKRYYYQFRARKDGAFSPWSGTAAFELSPYAPASMSPADGESTVTIKPLLSWTAGKGETAWLIQMATDIAALDAATPLALASPTHTVDLALALGSTLYWRVAPKTDSGFRGWSKTFSLAVSEWSYSLSPTPGNAATIDDTSPLLDWNDVEGAASYELQIAGGEAALGSAVPIAATDSNYQVPAGLELGTWYWRLRAMKSDGGIGPWSAIWTFNVEWSYAISATSPADAATIIDSTPLLDWSDAAGAASYELQIATTSEGLSDATPMAATESKHQVATDLAMGSWFWRARARNADGVAGAWSGAWSFTVTTQAGIGIDQDPQLPIAVTLSGQSASLYLGQGMTVSADSTETGLSYSWYLNGVAIAGANARTITVGADQEAGTYRLTAKVTKGSRSGTAYTTFTIDPLVRMVDVAGGTFLQGRQVTLSDFAIGKYEITFDQYDAFCTATSRSLVSDSGWGRGTRPVINVSWYDAVAFCNWLSGKEGFRAAYSGSGTSWTLDRTKNGYRLPTEAEWEYAARGGAATHGYTYSGSNDVNAVAWYGLNSGGKTQVVGGKAANELGIHDMSGNVWERNHDWYGSYPGTAEIDPVGLSSGSNRVIRGGSWGNDASECTVAVRTGNFPTYTDSYVGFRLARSH